MDGKLKVREFEKERRTTLRQLDAFLETRGLYLIEEESKSRFLITRKGLFPRWFPKKILATLYIDRNGNIEITVKEDDLYHITLPFEDFVKVYNRDVVVEFKKNEPKR